MDKAGELYVSGIKEKLMNYYAAWLPTESFRLGDVGILSGNLFKRITSLSDPTLRIAFDERPDTEPAPINFVSESGVKLYYKTKTELNLKLFPNVPKGKVGIGVEFGQQGAFIVDAPEVYQPSIENIRKVGEDILVAYQEGRWDGDWAAIVSIVHAPIASYIISRSSESKLEFAIEGDAKVGSIDFGNTAVEFELKSQTGDVIRLIKAKDTTPFFQIVRVYTSWGGLGEPSINYISPDKLGSRSSSIKPLFGLPAPKSIKGTPDSARFYVDLVRDSDPKVITI